MRIALLTDGIYPYVMGGMQKHSYYLAKYFARNKVHVDLYHFTETEESDIHTLEGFTKGEKEYIHSYVLEFPEKGRLPGHYIRESYEYSSRIYDRLRENGKVDFIYAQGYCGWRCLKEKEKGWQGPPIGVNFHGLEMYQTAPNFKARISQRLLRPPVKFNTLHADVVFSFGGKIRTIVNGMGVPPEKVIELPLGIEPEWIVNKIKSPGDLRRLVFLGRYEQRKGVEILTEVLDRLLPGRKLEFHFIGPIPPGKQLEKRGITYHGLMRDPDKVSQLLRSMDVLLCPSFSEGLPNVVVEAMASGLAVLASDVGAINSVLNEERGWLVPPGDRNALFNTILEALEISDAALVAKKENARDYVRDHLLWDRVIKDLLREIKTFIG